MRSWLLRLVAVALLLGLPPAVRPERTVACSCAEPRPSLEEILEEARAVFAGTVVSHGEYGDGSSARLVTEFRVSIVWKGRPPETIYLLERRSYDTCGHWTFPEGEQYLLYVPSPWSVPGPCDGRVVRLEHARRDLAMLGEGQPPEPGTSTGIPWALREAMLNEDSPLLPAWAIGLLAAGALVLAGTGFRVARRRAR